MPLKLPQQIIDNNRLNDEEDMSQDAAELNQIIKEGVLVKRNKGYWKQDRFFTLSRDGQLKYFEDQEHKGTIVLTRGSRVVKKKANHFEIVNTDRTWFLYSEAKNPERLIDAWIAAVRDVIAGL